MVVLRTQSEFGHAPPPQTQYSVITNCPGWAFMKGFRDGDKSQRARIVYTYPRIRPNFAVKELGQAIAQKLGLEGKGVFLYLTPLRDYTLRHIASSKRPPGAVLNAEEVDFRCVDIAGHRLFITLFDPAKAAGIFLTWKSSGLGLSIRGAELLLSGVDEVKEVPYGPLEDKLAPKPTWTPERAAHRGLRGRIVQLLQHAAIDPAKVADVGPQHVYLYPTGMAAIFHTTNLLVEYRKGTSVVAGIAFQDTYRHLIEESPYGWKHNGLIDEQGLNELEAWLQVERTEGRLVSYVFVEFSGNPTPDTVNLPRLKKLSEEYGFVLVADDTVAGFGNVDLLSQADILLTSLTKSFSGYANVMGGSIVLNPLSPHHAALSTLFASHYHNELFANDAEVLLANSQDYFARTQTLNRNAHAVAAFLHSTISDQESPVTNVQYPSFLPSRSNYDALKRKPSAELPEPGYGCLLSVEFESVDATAAFYDRLGFYSSPHLGGHVSIMLPYHMMSFGGKPEEDAYMRNLGAREESIRLSVGLESEEDLIDTIKDALEAAIEVKKNGGRTVKLNS